MDGCVGGTGAEFVVDFFEVGGGGEGHMDEGIWMRVSDRKEGSKAF